VAAADTARAKSVAEQVGGTASEGVAEATRGADVIVLAVPHGAVANLAGQLDHGTAGKVVIDATNPLKTITPAWWSPTALAPRRC